MSFTPPTDPGGSSARDLRGDLLSSSFLALLATQFLGALNDNMFRWLVVPIGKYRIGDDFAAAALSAGLACFVLPYIILAAPAGYLADRFSKRSVIIGCKVAEVVIMVMGITAIWLGNVYVLFVVVALMGSQSALFGPSKFGAIPELLRAEKLSAGNGLVGLTTVLAVVSGTVIGNYLYTWTGPGGQHRLWISALALSSVALLGCACSLGVGHRPAADPQRLFPINPLARTLKDLKILTRSRPLLRVALGIAFFWSLASLAQLNVDVFGMKELQLEQKDIGPLLGILSLSVGVGSVLAGVLSAGRVELGLVPLGGLGIAASSMMLFTVPDPTQASSAAFRWTAVWLCGLGLSAGLFDVPLQAFMQHRSPTKSRGSILAAGNFLTFSGMLVTAGAFWFLRQPADLSARQIFLLAGILTLAVAIYAVAVLPQATLRMVVWLATHTVYRVRVFGRENLPEYGGALLVANHVSWLDGVLLLITSSRPIRLIVHADFVQGWWISGVARLVGVIPIKPTPKATWSAIRSARKALQAGQLVCIFPEGTATRTGQLQPFKPGVLQILKGTSIPVIPVYLDELFGSLFSVEGGKLFWKRPVKWPYPVSIWFGSQTASTQSIHDVRQAVQDLGAEAVQERKDRTMNVPRMMLRHCRRAMFRRKVADSSGVELTGAQLLMRSLILRRVLAREGVTRHEHIGILLPPSAGGVVVNAAVLLARRISANLNYSASAETVNICINTARIRHVLTSRRVMERIPLKIDAEIVYLEDIKDRVTLGDKLLAAMMTFLVPSCLLERILGLHRLKGDDCLTVIFTSGSTGVPKGVMLTHHNIATNVEAIDQIIQVSRSDIILGVLPFFHSFGFTVTLCGVLGLNVQGVYHFTPLDPKQVGKLCRKYRANILLSTATFLRSYLRRSDPDDLKSLEIVVAGAEKLPVDLAAAFEERFGVRPVEGYGTTELSPLVSVNVPPSRSPQLEIDRKEGTVGRPVPGVSAKIVDPDSFRVLPVNTPGMLMIKGPNVMKGYLNEPEKSAEVIRDGWYVTGDIALIDEDGFIQITGRLSRFSKIGGEMVPHIRIEELLQGIISSDPDEIHAVVTAVPDPKKGERLVVVHTELPRPTDEICRELADAGLPNLWMPSPDSFLRVDEIPVLGSGKVDLRAVREMAEERLEAKTG